MKSRPRLSAAFTLTEMIVAVAILVIIILAVGKVFQSTGGAVSQAQALGEALSNVRAVQLQIQRDLQGLNKDGYLVIRSRANSATYANGNSYYVGDCVFDTTNSAYYTCTSAVSNAATAPSADVVHWVGIATSQLPRADQLAFLAYGQFPHHTGLQNGSTAGDTFSSNAAAIWYGHLAFEDGTGSQSTNLPSPGGSPNNYDDSQVGAGLPANFGHGASQYTLGRSAMLLSSADGNNNTYLTVQTGPTTSIFIPAYPSLAFNTQTTTPIAAPSETKAYICSSRLDAVALTPSQVALGTTPASLINNYCYRFKSLSDSYAPTDVGTVINSALRMHPIFLQSVASFAVQWTDGTVTGSALNWYGSDDTNTVVHMTTPDATVEPVPVAPDSYEATFGPFNKAKWPKALKITMTVSDPSSRTLKPLTFTQVVKLP